MDSKGSLLPQNELGRSFLAKYTRTKAEIHKDVIELDMIIEMIFIAMLADGHIILDGEPGVGKTLVARTTAKTIAASCSFIQFTPETMPQDLFFSMGCFGNDGSGRTLSDMTLSKGPIFSRIIIADEINRAIPRIQGALLAPLEERKITLEGKVHDFAPFYFWIATQNPVETSESTSRLPEALKERFLLMARIPYPSPALLRKIAIHDTRSKQIEETLVIEEIVTIREAILEQYVLTHREGDAVITYIQRLINAIHDHPAVKWGPGIRAVQDLTRAAGVHAFLHERQHIAFDDIKRMALPVLRFKFQLDAGRARRHQPRITDNDDVIREVLSFISLSVKEEDDVGIPAD
jgi:MoxR-like ATPase